MDISFASAVVILLLVTDPIGNIPLFVSLLRHVKPARRLRVIARECAIALAVLLVFVLFGRTLLDIFGLSERSLNLSGGVILFLIALRMIFRNHESNLDDTPAGEPLMVLLVSRAPQRLPEWLAAITVAIAVSFVVLMFAERISRWMGERVLEAFERLMGLLLTTIAVEMLLRGIEGFVRYLQPS